MIIACFFVIFLNRFNVMFLPQFTLKTSINRYIAYRRSSRQRKLCCCLERFEVIKKCWLEGVNKAIDG